MERKTRSVPEVRSHLYPGQRVKLLAPRVASPVSVEEALAQRRSTREYSDKPLSMAETSQLLWAAQGVTGAGGLRTAPSAGAIYPLRTYLLAGAVEGLPAGVYGFDPDAHELEFVTRGDRRARLFEATHEQVCAAESPIAVLLAGWFTRATREFGALARDLALIEAGHAGQSFLLQAVALRLAAMVVGKFEREALSQICHLPASQVPLYLMLAGHPH